MSLLNVIIVYACTFSTRGLFQGRTDFVAELAPDSYRDAANSLPVSSKSDWVVMHYSAMCGHCIRFAPEFIEIATAFRFVSRLRFAAIDLSEPENRPIIAEQEIRYLPLIRLFQIVERDPGVFVRETQTLVPTRRGLVSALEIIYAGRDALPEPGSGFAELPSTRLLNDAASFVRDGAISLWVVLNTAVFKGSSTMLENDDLVALRMVLFACESVFDVRSVADACGRLKLVVESASGSGLSKQDWETAVKANENSFPQLIRNSPQASLSSCSTMTCALWRLLHLFSLGKGGSPSVTISPSDAMLAIHAVVDKFFLCQECREHFVAHYDNCDFGRCVSPSPTWKQTALWLWEFHNAVTERVYPNRPQWPSKNECPACYHNLDATYDYLWSRFSLAGTPLSMIQDNNGATRISIRFIHVLVSLFVILL